MNIIILGAIVLAITQLVKITVNMTSRYVPLTSLIVALAIFLLAAVLSKTTVSWDLVQNAIITGLTAGGLWSGTKATIGE